MLLKPGHDLDEIAGHMAVIELILQNLIPAVAAGARGARQAEDVFASGDAGGRPRLHGRGADLAKGDIWKATLKPSISFSKSGRMASTVTSWPVSPVPPVEMITSMAGVFSHVRICRRMAAMLVLDERASGERVAGLRDPRRERVSGFVIGQRAAVGYGQHGNPDWNECRSPVRARKPSSVKPSPEGQEIAPGETFLRRLAQQIGGMKRRQERNGR